MDSIGSLPMVEKGNKYISTCVDFLKTKDPEEVASAIWDNVIGHLGPP